MEFFEDEIKRSILILIISGASLVLDFLGIPLFGIRFAWVAVVLCGVPIVKEAVTELVLHGDIKAGILVTLAIIASIFTDELFAAGEVAAIMVLGEVLEDITVDRAKAGIENLVKSSPDTARVVSGGEEKIISADEVKVGDIIRVLPGEMIAVDGIIVSGKTSIDQSSVTGEPIPEDKSEGDKVFSGTVNQFGAFDFKALKTGENSSFQKMVRLVEEADADKAKIVGVADRWAFWIVIIAAAIAVVTYIVTKDTKRAVTVLVVFCPCALVVATPAAVMAGIGNAAKKGILVKSGDALERLSGVHKLAFDKTGTITYGKASLFDVMTAEGVDKEKLLEYAASAESKSEHPLAAAVVAYYKKNGGSFLDVSDFAVIPGEGIRGNVDGHEVLISNKADYAGVFDESDISSHMGGGRALSFVFIDGVLSGALVMSDEIRENVGKIVSSVENMGVGCMLITGDSRPAAEFMGSKAGIKEIYAGCLPEDKMSIIKKHQDDDINVCMIGDGINDAPSLKSAHVGIAMGVGGTDIAMDAADIALIKDNIDDIPHLLALSEKMMKTINKNIIFSMSLNFAAVLLAVLGILNPAGGAVIHNAGSVAVIINSALLLKYKLEQ